MNRRDFIKNMGMGIAAMALPGCGRFGQSTTGDALGQRPNFVFFLIDDLGWRDLGCYGSSFYETPNIDDLARKGVRFSNAYAACPVCSPTRASIMTGKYPARLKLTNYLVGRRWPKDSPIAPPKWCYEMPLEEVTLAEALKEAGYKTCFIGKWHLGEEPYYPEHQGFDVNVGGTNSGLPRSHFYPKWGDNPPIKGEDGEYLADRLTDESLKFLEANSDGPFLLYLSHYGVHTPLEGKEELVAKYEAKAKDMPAEGPKFLHKGNVNDRQVQDHAVYAAMVESIDESVGRVLAKVDELGLTGNTIVIFMSDNGGLSTAEGSPTSNVPLRAGKGLLYEGGIREPMIINWPGVTKPGSICNEPVTSTDFYPTMLEMAGLGLRPKQHIDGMSLCSILRGKRGLKRKAIYWHYPHYSNQGGRPGGAVRCGDYKLIERYEDNSIELYNLREDIGEKRELSAAVPAKAQELRKMLHKWREDVDANMPRRKAKG